MPGGHDGEADECDGRQEMPDRRGAAPSGLHLAAALTAELYNTARSKG